VLIKCRGFLSHLFLYISIKAFPCLFPLAFNKELQGSGRGSRICQTIVQTYNDFLEPETKEKVTNMALAQNLIDGMAYMISKMGLK
jgi:hypothetical protein